MRAGPTVTRLVRQASLAALLTVGGLVGTAQAGAISAPLLAPAAPTAIAASTAPDSVASVMTVADVLNAQAIREGWCVRWESAVRPIGPALHAWRLQGPDDSLVEMVHRGVVAWDRATSFTWQISDREDFVDGAVTAKVYRYNHVIVIEPQQDRDQLPPGESPLLWGHCEGTAAAKSPIADGLRRRFDPHLG